MSKKEFTVAITGFGGLNQPEPGKSIAEAIHTAFDVRANIIALVKNLRETSAWTCLPISQIIQISECLDDASRFLSEILKVNSKHKLDIIIPGTNLDACLLSKISDTLHRHGVKTIVPSVSSFELMRPDLLSKLDLGEKVKVPKSILVTSNHSFEDVSRLLDFPLVIRSDRFQSKVIFDSSAIENYFESTNLVRSDLYAQEHIVGEAYEVVGLVDDDGKLIVSAMVRGIAIRKDGTIGAGAIINDPTLEECFKKISKSLNWKGILNVCLRFDANKKQYILIDLRAHLPAWCMASYWSNGNLAQAFIDYLLNNPIEKNRKLQKSSLYLSSIDERVFPIAAMTQYQAKNFHHPLNVSKNIAGKENLNNEKAIRVAVTGLSCLDVVNPGVGVANALKLSGNAYDLIGIAYDNFDSGVFQKSLFNKVYKFNIDASSSEILGKITELHQAHPIDVLIPCLDGELEKYIEINAELKKLGIATLLPGKGVLRKRCKKGLCELDNDWEEFSIPKCYIASNKQKVLSAGEDLGLPVMIKGLMSRSLVANSKYELETYYKYFESIGEKEVVLQRKVNGAHYAVSVVCDENHDVVSSVSIKKFARCVRGSTWGAVNVFLPRLEQAFAKLLKSIHWVGPAEGEFILDEYTDHFYLFEINPRFTGWIYFASQLGENQPQMVADLALSKNITNHKEMEKMFFMRSAGETIVTSKDLALFTTQGRCIHA